MPEESRQVFDMERPQSAAEVLSYDTLYEQRLALIRLLDIDCLSQDLVDSVFQEPDLEEVIMASFDDIGRRFRVLDEELLDVHACILVYTVANITEQVRSNNAFLDIGVVLPTADYWIPKEIAEIFNKHPHIISVCEYVVALLVGHRPKPRKMVDAFREKFSDLWLWESQYAGICDLLYIRNLEYILGTQGYEPGYRLVWGKDGDHMVDIRALQPFEWVRDILDCPWKDTFSPPEKFGAVVCKILEDSINMYGYVYEPNLPLYKTRVLALIYALGPEWVMDRVETIIQLDERLAGHLAWLRKPEEV